MLPKPKQKVTRYSRFKLFQPQMYNTLTNGTIILLNIIHTTYMFNTGLQWLRGTLEVHDEMDEMRAENEAMKVIPRVTLREMLSNPMLKTPLAISVMIMLCQQLSGINAVSDPI